MSQEAAVRAHIEGRVGVLTLNRPHALNSFNTQMMAELTASLREFEKDDRVLAIVLHGEGRCFSAGFDMKESAARNTTGEAAWRKVLEEDFDFIMQFWHCSKPTIAAAHGYCIGGAFELLMACDMSVASETALFGSPEVRFGSGIVAMIAPYVIGPKQAKELLLTGNDRVSAARCLQMGILNRVVSEGEELAAAMELAEQIAGAVPQSVQATKKAINQTYEQGAMEPALKAALEIDIAIEADMSPERIEFNRIRKEEGLQAALEWRDNRLTA